MISSRPAPYALTRLLSLKAGPTMKIHGIDDPVRSLAGVRKGNVHGLRDKSSDGAWSYRVENYSIFDPFAAGMRGAFRRKRNDINAQSAITLAYTQDAAP
jgi:hypothetical protein